MWTIAAISFWQTHSPSRLAWSEGWRPPRRRVCIIILGVEFIFQTHGIIITEMIFMVLSSWQSHCECSPGSFDEYRLSAEVAANPQTKPADLDCESAGKKWQLPSTSTIAIYYYSAR